MLLGRRRRHFLFIDAAKIISLLDQARLQLLIVSTVAVCHLPIVSFAIHEKHDLRQKIPCLYLRSTSSNVMSGQALALAKDLNSGRKLQHHVVNI